MFRDTDRPCRRARRALLRPMPLPNRLPCAGELKAAAGSEIDVGSPVRDGADDPNGTAREQGSQVSQAKTAGATDSVSELMTSQDALACNVNTYKTDEAPVDSHREGSRCASRDAPKWRAPTAPFSMPGRHQPSWSWKPRLGLFFVSRWPKHWREGTRSWRITIQTTYHTDRALWQLV